MIVLLLLIFLLSPVTAEDGLAKALPPCAVRPNPDFLLHDLFLG